MFTKGQQNDVEIARYFIPEEYRHVPITVNDIERFIASSEHGTERWNRFTGVANGFDALSLGKSRRGLAMAMWEEGVLRGEVPYITLLREQNGQPIPRPVVDFMRREMFKGEDAAIIESAYQTV